MDYEKLWETLETLMIELAEKRVQIPQEFKEDLKSAKTFISIFQTDPSDLTVVTEIELFLGKIEPSLLYLAESDVNPEYADEWVKKINDARVGQQTERVSATSKFVSGASMGEHWIRIKALGLINDKELRELSEKFSLSCETQENGYLLIRGKEENVKSFVKEVGERIKKREK
ncbi:MAG: DUF2096 family protein [Candidatus Bathyarchaeota archaeon]